MPTALKSIRVLSDGRPGHENQSLGLAEALQRRTGATIEVISLDLDWWPVRLVREAGRAPAEGRVPQVLIAAGHRMQFPLFMAARKFDAFSVLLMRPMLPAGLFDLCLVPRHDLKNGESNTPNIVATRGALNRIAEELPPKSNRAMILLGGPSKHHEWDERGVLERVSEITTTVRDRDWIVATSRRTPDASLRALKARCPELKVVAPDETRVGWLAGELLQAGEVWVTEDSISMVYEAITARAKVGLLPLPLRSGNGRVTRGLEELLNDGYATRFDDWLRSGRRLKQPPVLHETARCADIVLQRRAEGTAR